MARAVAASVIRVVISRARAAPMMALALLTPTATADGVGDGDGDDVQLDTQPAGRSRMKLHTLA